jgi:polyribonucleotide nucleotidyltransferase
MDSKQLAMLGKVKPKPITLSEVYGLISQQILIGKMSVASLTMQAEYCKALKNAQDFTISITNKKIELLKKLNDLREEQLKEFDEIRQEECNMIVSEINELDEPNAEYFTIAKQLETMKSEQNQLIEKINMLQQSLPDEKVLDFYKVKPKLDQNPYGTCAAEITPMD